MTQVSSAPDFSAHTWVQPSPRFCIRQTRDVDLQADSLSGWQQDYEQVSAGRFDGAVRELITPAVQVFEELANCATVQSCHTWPGGLWVGMAVPEQAHGLRFLGRPVEACELMMAANCQFELQVPAEVGLYGVVIDIQALHQHVLLMNHDRWQASDWSVPRTQTISALQRWRLAGLVREVLSGLQRNPAALQHEASCRSLQQALLTVVAEALQPDRAEPVLCRRSYRRRQLVDKAKALALAQPDLPLDVAALCAELHVTRRTLQNCFHDVMGISPATYLRTLRFNAVRRALRDAGADDADTVAHIAASWGFWHMGHFSHDYKHLFGESPSVTRRRRNDALPSAGTHSEYS